MPLLPVSASQEFKRAAVEGDRAVAQGNQICADAAEGRCAIAQDQAAGKCIGSGDGPGTGAHLHHQVGARNAAQAVEGVAL